MLQTGQWLTFIVPYFFFFHYLFILFDRLYYSTRFGEILNPSYSQEEVPWTARTNTSHIATHAFEIVSLTPTLPFYDVFNSCVLRLRYLDLYHFSVAQSSWLLSCLRSLVHVFLRNHVIVISNHIRNAGSSNQI